jgi:hypothetical protein
MADDALHALRSLEERLEQVSEAAERLMEDAPRARQTKPPPAGWQQPAEDSSRPPAAELESLLVAIRSLREVIPPEVAQRLIAAVRELLLAIRALIDWYLERLERRRQEPPEVEDIPIQ